jgi:DNA-binding IclR family transcriptional regulator
LTEVAARTELSTNQAFRLLQTLAGAGYVRQETETKVYSLGHRLFGLVGALFHGDALLVAAGDVLTWVHERTGETVALVAADGDDTICLDVRESSHPLLVAATVGTRSNHFHAGAVGKVLLAAWDDEAIDAYLATHSPLRRMSARTPVTVEAVWAEVRLARVQGYAVSEEEVAAGMYGIAAPVRDRRGAVVASITLSAPLSRVGEEERCLHREVVVEAARRVSGNLGYREGVLINS